jgi:pimeloyl-ACP methyl ester carboxylesterase
MRLLSNFLILFLTLASYSVSAAELVSLKTRGEVTQKFILIKPDNPTASVILFSGGAGTLKLSSVFGTPSLGAGTTNFLVRSRDLFADKGLMVAVVDAPSDKQRIKGMFKGFRSSEEHVTDIDAVITYMKQQADIPVWLVGTSRGTESATHITINSAQQVSGLVLTSSMSKRNKGGKSVVMMDLAKVTQPTLIASHENDGCANTPPEGAELIKDKLVNASSADVIIFQGGRETGDSCKGLSYHGFLGIEDKVVDKIYDFITAN